MVYRNGFDRIRKAMKKTVSILLTILLFCTSICPTFAAPGMVSCWDMGNTAGLVYVTNPSWSGMSVADSYCAVSGWAVPGAVVSLYRANDSGIYEWAAGGMTVGGSGMFFMPVWLNSGRNFMLVRAESWDGRYQQIRCDINLVGQGISFLTR